MKCGDSENYKVIYIYIHIEDSLYIYIYTNGMKYVYFNDYKPRILGGMIYLALFKVIWFLSKNGEPIEGLLDSVLFFEVP